jgi:mannose/fructose/N-acetylgalactosamine-specific phosphotransferase system component IIB
MHLHVRIDDRLLHGQVTYGWMPVLRPSLVLIADDRAAADEWERETYLASEVEGVSVEILDLAAAAARLSREGAAERTLLLVRGPIELLRLVRAGLRVPEAVVGGLHAGAGRVAFAEDLQVSKEEALAFSALGRSGVRCYYQPLPTSEVSALPDMTRITEEE